MRKLLLVAFAVFAVFLFLPTSLMATDITLGASTQTCSSSNLTGCIAITGSAGGPFTVTFPSTLSGATIPGGGYSFTGVGPLTFTGGSAAVGSPFTSGTGGTLTLLGTPFAVTWTLLDCDGAGYCFSFSIPGSTGVAEITLKAPVNTGAPANFAALFASGGTADAAISSGQVNVPEPESLLLLGSGLLGLAGVGMRRLFR